jgi:hypothetical protein
MFRTREKSSTDGSFQPVLQEVAIGYDLAVNPRNRRSIAKVHLSTKATALALRKLNIVSPGF